MKSRMWFRLGLCVLFLSAALPLRGSIVNTPVLQWRGDFGDGGHLRSIQVGVDGAGNFYQAGHTSITPQPAWVVKHTELGVQEWLVKVAGSSPRTVSAMEVDPAGNVFVAGQQGTSIQNDVFVLKLNSSGQLLWQKVFDVATVEHSMDLALTPGGDAYLLSIAGEGSSAASVLMRLQGSTGSALWVARHLQSTVGFPFRVAAFSTGDAAVGAYTGGNMQIARYRISTGMIQWRSTVDTGFQERVNDLTVDRTDDSVVVCGSCTTSANTDWLTVRLTSLGAVQWTRQLNGQGNLDDIPSFVKVGPMGSVFVAGNQLRSPGGFGAWFTPSVVCYSRIGKFAFNAQVPNEDAANFMMIRGFTVDADGYTYVVNRDDTDTPDAVRASAFSPQGSLLWQVVYDERSVGNRLDPTGIEINANNVLWLGGTCFHPPAGNGVTDANIFTLAYR